MYLYRKEICAEQKFNGFLNLDKLETLPHENQNLHV